MGILVLEDYREDEGPLEETEIRHQKDKRKTKRMWHPGSQVKRVLRSKE